MCLDNTMMRRMIGRYKGFRCARMVVGVTRWGGVNKGGPVRSDAGPQEMEELPWGLEITPHVSATGIRSAINFGESEDLQRYIDGMRKAGMPE